MARTKWTSKIVVMLLTLVSPGCTKSAPNSVEQQRASSAVFDQFETVFYAKGDLLSGSGGYKSLSQQDASALRAPFAYLLAGLDVLGKPATQEILGNTNAVLMGAKDFRPPRGPTGLGAVQSRFCYVLVLGTRSAFQIGKIVSKFGAVSPADVSTWKWSAAPTEGHPEPHPFYATQVAHSYVLISNNFDDLQRMSAKLSASNTAPSLSSIRGWESISQHEVWGYRRYRHDESEKVAAGTTEVKPDAQGLVFFLDLKQKAGVVRLYSSTAGTADKLNKTHLLSPFKPVGKEAWETIIPLAGDQNSSDQMFVAMSLLGFGVYL